MAEVSLQQIIDRLNNAFVSDQRTLIFWYDDDAEFENDIQEIGQHLNNAKLIVMNSNEQFKTKTIINRVEPKTSFLIYSPERKPDAKLNFLMDEGEYSREFTANYLDFVAMEIGIPATLRQTMKEHERFFRNKERIQRLANLELRYQDEHVLLLGMMAALTNCRIADIEEVTRQLLNDKLDNDNKYLTLFAKYNLVESFWNEINLHFGYQSDKPILIQFVCALILNLTYEEFKIEMPESVANYRLARESTALVFINNYMNNIDYQERYNELSRIVYQYLDGATRFNRIPIDAMARATTFEYFDIKLLTWSIERLLDQDFNAQAGGLELSELADSRIKMHFGIKYAEDYHVIKHAEALLKHHEVVYGTPEEMVTAYKDNGYNVDQHYRKFYYHLHQVGNQDSYTDLQKLVERTYVSYLQDSISEWNNEFSLNQLNQYDFSLQRDFYRDNIVGQHATIAVIISDAFRYEIGVQLAQQLNFNTKNVVQLDSALTGVPSITPFGMAQLLPHKLLSYNDEKHSVDIDGQYSSGTENREKILQSRNANSVAIQFDRLKKMSVSELRDFRANQEVIYIYHNQIDARGDNQKTEDEVFKAAEDAVTEIQSLIKRLANSASISNFIVTADHGFIYRENRLDASDKIDLQLNSDDRPGQRYLISEQSYDSEPGIKSALLSDVLDNTDQHHVNYPKSLNVFQNASGGRNYVHGGSSIQEMLIPVLHVTVKRDKSENRSATLRVITGSNRITNLSTNIEFLQDEPISEVVVPAQYKIYFVTENNEVISNEQIISTDLKDNDVNNRRFRVSFVFKEQKYDMATKYYMLIVNYETGVISKKIPYIMDIAFAGGFGFDI